MAKDGKVHRQKVVDAATMEGYRGSGYNELPRGVYVEDENGVLIRMRSFSEATAVMEGLKKKPGDQEGRQLVLKEMIKNWFVDNEYVDDTMEKDEYMDQITGEQASLDLEQLQATIPNVKDLRKLSADDNCAKLVISRITVLKNHLQKPSDPGQENNEKTIALLNECISICKEYMDGANVKKEKERISIVSRYLSACRAMAADLGNNDSK